MHNKEILAAIADLYPDGFPEGDICGDGVELKGLTEEQILKIFRLAFVLGKRSVKP